MRIVIPFLACLVAFSTNAQETLQTVTDRGASTTNKIGTNGFYINGSGYDKPAAYLLHQNDGNWSYGGSSDGVLHYWLQATFHGAATQTRGFRIFDNYSNTYPFLVNGKGNIGVGVNEPPFAITLKNNKTISFNSDPINPFGIEGGDNAQTRVIMGASSGAASNIAFGVSNGSGSSGFAEKMRIDAEGKVGIGTASPVFPLDIVKSGAVISRVYNNSSSADARIRTQNTLGLMEMGIDATGGYLQAYNNIPLIYHLGGAERMRITADGNFAIGTANPQGYKLAVAGNVIAESVKVALRGSWPDYVFKPENKLLSLQEVEKYVKVNNHLPEMPSEAEVKKEGIDLGQMDAKLLKKIEELTLHLIEQNKRIEELERQLKK